MMIKRIYKILPRIHGSKANIVFLVAFIMFVSSLLGLLVSEYVKNMIKTSYIFQNYYHTYYLAYGGLEIGLTQAKYHGYGFQDSTVTTGLYCISSGCSVTTTILSRSSVVADSYEARDSCTGLYASGGSSQSYMNVLSGDCFIIPLYYDTATGFSATNYYELTNSNFVSSAPSLYQSGISASGEDYTIRIIDEDLLNTDSLIDATFLASNPYAYADSISGFIDTSKNYLIIANPSGTTKEFCHYMTGSYKLPMKYISITSVGVDGRNTISLNAIKNNELPSFLCYGAINP